MTHVDSLLCCYMYVCVAMLACCTLCYMVHMASLSLTLALLLMLIVIGHEGTCTLRRER